jgi:citrate lyase beta subunit
MTTIRPRRSLLFMPASNARALEKAKSIPCDVAIFDLEDAVSPDHKITAREQIAKALETNDYGHREIVVRINALATLWGMDDAQAIATSKADAILLPKVESAAQVQALAAICDKPIWCNIETAKGVIHAAEIAAHPRVAAIVAGTNDLSAELSIRKSPERTGLLHALSQMVLAARAYGKLVFDGTFTAIADDRGLLNECRQGRILGFDGKTLIHPDQVNIANDTYSPTSQEIEEAQQIVSIYTTAMNEKKAVATSGGKMIEKLHYDAANRLLQMDSAIQKCKA